MLAADRLLLIKKPKQRIFPLKRDGFKPEQAYFIDGVAFDGTNPMIIWRNLPLFERQASGGWR